MIARQPVLRTAFEWQGATLLQCVESAVRFTLTRLDWTDVAEADQPARLTTWPNDDRRQGLDAPRAAAARHADPAGGAAMALGLAHHHLLLDGWSLPLLMAEVLAAYDATVTGRPLVLPPVRPYREYISWLRHQDPAAAAAGLRETLAGFAEATTLRVGPRPAGPAAAAVAQLTLSLDETAALQQWVRRHQLTLNTLVTGAWARLLQTYSGQTDVLFGVTVAGRPAELPNLAEMIGLFIYTLPLRIGPKRRPRRCRGCTRCSSGMPGCGIRARPSRRLAVLHGAAARPAALSSLVALRTIRSTPRSPSGSRISWFRPDRIPRTARTTRSVSPQFPATG